MRAVLFDVDFTLIYPGPTFQAEGYVRFCAKHRLTVDPTRFEAAVAGASTLLDEAQEAIYDPGIFVRYTTHIIRHMGGDGAGLEACAREIYDEWAACQHFFLYDDVAPVLTGLRDRGLRIGLVSNTHRSLASFQSHFELTGLIAAAVSSSQHGYMKPHPSIFEAALRLVGASPADAVMVGDSVTQDIAGALGVGMRAVLVARSGHTASAPEGVPVIRSLTELPALI